MSFSIRNRIELFEASATDAVSRVVKGFSIRNRIELFEAQGYRLYKKALNNARYRVSIRNRIELFEAHLSRPDELPRCCFSIRNRIELFEAL